MQAPGMLFYCDVLFLCGRVCVHTFLPQKNNQLMCIFTWEIDACLDSLMYLNEGTQSTHMPHTYQRKREIPYCSVVFHLNPECYAQLYNPEHKEITTYTF